MVQTGQQQAEVMYKVRIDTGEPVDADGELTSISNKRQAIALLVGVNNPNTALFEVVRYYSAKSSVNGISSVRYSKDCPAGYLTFTPDFVQLTPAQPSQTVVVDSQFIWTIVSMPPQATASVNGGGVGITNITFTRTAVLGNAQIILRAQGVNEDVILKMRNLESTGWILETGFWNMYKLWDNTATWIY